MTPRMGDTDLKAAMRGEALPSRPLSERGGLVPEQAQLGDRGLYIGYEGATPRTCTVVHTFPGGVYTNVEVLLDPVEDKGRPDFEPEQVEAGRARVLSLATYRHAFEGEHESFPNSAHVVLQQ